MSADKYESDHDLNDIERRLQAMRPAEPAPSVKTRIAQTLAAGGAEPDERCAVAAASPWVHRLPRSAVFAVAAAVVLAVGGMVAVLVLQGPAGRESADVDGPPAPEPQRHQPKADAVQPTLIALTRAWNQSPDSLDAMLEKIATDRRGQAATKRNPPMPTVADYRQWSNEKGLP